jgi:hypothetical protein
MLELDVFGHNSYHKDEEQRQMEFHAERVQKQFCKGFGQKYGEDLAICVCNAFFNLGEDDPQYKSALRIMDDLGLDMLDALSVIGNLEFYMRNINKFESIDLDTE